MAKNYYQDNGNAWASKTFNGYGEWHNKYEKEYNKYFDSNGSLKKGYTQREIGNNRNIGEVAYYGQQTEDDDDGNSESWRYGIFGAPTPKAAPKPKPKKAAPKVKAYTPKPLNTSKVYKKPAQVSNYNAANDARAAQYQKEINALKASNASRNKQYTSQIDQLKSQFNTQSSNFQNLQSMYAGQMNKYNQSQANWNKQFANQQSAFDTKYGNLTNQFNASVDKYDGMIDDLKIQNSTNLSNLNASFRASMKPVSQNSVGIKTKKSKAKTTGSSSQGTRQLSRDLLSISNINL